MSQLRVSKKRDIDARPETVYSVLSDYKSGHPHILPEKNFSDFRVLEGGIGEGTQICFQFHLMGLKKTMRAVITEPEPGRILKETDLETGAVTTFEVEPNDDGLTTSVTIITEWESGGLKGAFERMFVTSGLEKVYDKELHLLDQYMNAEV